MKNIGLEIKKILLDRNINPSQLALMIGTSKQNVHQMLDKEDIKVSTLEKIADVLNLHVSEILGENIQSIVNEPIIEYKKRKNESEMLFEVIESVQDLQEKVKRLERLLRISNK